MDLILDLWNTINQDLPVLAIMMKIVVIVAPIMLMVAYFTYAERKFISYMHVRLGPTRLLPKGWLQPIADEVTLML